MKVLDHFMQFCVLWRCQRNRKNRSKWSYLVINTYIKTSKYCICNIHWGQKKNSLSSMKYNVEAVEDEMAVLGPQGRKQELDHGDREVLVLSGIRWVLNPRFRQMMLVHKIVEEILSILEILERFPRCFRRMDILSI